MEKEVVVQGQTLTVQDIQFISQLIEQHPSWSRRRLSEYLCKQWGWYNPRGQLKDMAARSMMLKLEKLGHIKLPPRRQKPTNRMFEKIIPWVAHEKTLIECPLRKIQPLQVLLTWKKHIHEDLFCCLLSHYHYLGYKGIVGENMKYVILDRDERVVCCMLFGSSAWKVNRRDSYIGWDADTRKRNLHLTTNNMRFLILPWVRIAHLASHVLGLICRRISSDWIERYGHPIYMLETFVEKDRFTGTCYKAANWIYVGQTKGRSRNDRYNRLQLPVKDVYLYPLISNFKQKLTHR